MKRNNLWILVVLFSLGLSSCSLFQKETATVEPTEDIQRLRTEVAQTIVARVTYDSALTKAAEPSATALILSPSPESAVTTPTLTQTLPIITFTPTATLPTATPSQTIEVIYPTWTPTYYPDRAVLVSQSPADGTNFSPGLGFDLVFELKNTGDRAWNSNFYLKFISGIPGETHSGSTITLVYLPQTVAAGETVQIVVDMVAPKTSGGYSSNWSFINDDGTAILWPNLVFYVSS